MFDIIHEFATLASQPFPHSLDCSKQNAHAHTHKTFRSSVKSRLGKNKSHCSKLPWKDLFFLWHAVTSSTLSVGEEAGSSNLRQIMKAKEQTWQNWWGRWGWRGVTVDCSGANRNNADECLPLGFLYQCVYPLMPGLLAGSIYPNSFALIQHPSHRFDSRRQCFWV